MHNTSTYAKTQSHAQTHKPPNTCTLQRNLIDIDVHIHVCTFTYAAPISMYIDIRMPPHKDVQTPRLAIDIETQRHRHNRIEK